LPPPTAVFDGRWEKALSVAAYGTNPSAVVKIVEFVDFECPVCARAHAVIRDVEDAYGSRLSVSFVHFPLTNHSHARVGALAVECADRQGKAREAMNVLFTQRTSIRSADSTAFARKAGIVDTSAYVQCIASNAGIARIEAGLSVGDSLKIGGTPTFFVNGWRYDGAISKEHLSEAIDDLLAHKPPRHSGDGR
jgi:protein-disulfide isomerase